MGGGGVGEWCVHDAGYPFHVMLTLGMSGAAPSLPHTSSCQGGKLKKGYEFTSTSVFHNPTI